MRPAIAAATIAAFVCFAAPARGQDDAVLVTATRFAEDARRLPASVTVLTAEDIAKSAARTLPELLSEQVGLTMKDFFGNNASLTSVDLRGFGVTGGQNTLILLDGRRVTDIDLSGVQWSAIPLVSIERIEVLRGTGAVLYGDGASAGVINIVTRSPLREGARLEAFGRAATFNTQEGQLYGSFASGELGANASLYGLTSDGYRANNRNEQQNSTADLRWAPGDSTIDLRLATDRQDLGLPGARRIQPSIGLDEHAADRRGAQTPLDYASRDGARAGLVLAHRFGEAEVSLGLDWRDKQARSFFAQQLRAQHDALEVRSVTPRARLPFRLGATGHRLTIGADWHSWRYDSRRDAIVENLGQPVNRVRVSQRTQAFYLHDLIEVGRATQLAIGARSERVRFEASDTLDMTAPGFLGFQMAAPEARETQRQRAWELGLRHALTRELALFARAGRSFRFVNADEIYEFDAFFAPQFQILRPQQARTHEAGVEWRAAGRFARATLFRTEVTNEIHLDPFSTGIGNTNLPPSRREGLELEGAWQASAALRLTAGYAYTDARFRQGVLPGGPFVIGTNLEIGGKRVPLVPEHKTNAGFAWDISGRTRLSGALAAVSSQIMDNDEPNTLGVRIPGYYLLDLKLAHAFGWGRLALSVNNLLNRSYYTYAVRSQFAADRYAVYPLPRRAIGVTAEFKLE